MRKALIIASLIPALCAGAAFAAGNDASGPSQPGVAPRAAAHMAASVNDAELTRQVNETVSKLGAQLGAKIDAQVVNGDVVLSGTAPSQDAISRIAEEAARVPGVKSVRSQVNLLPAG
ncbi:BON domain-containing protein [Chromobacterium sp. CV08]|uniref:BON domain-containing protein n=1 Tax=Chromobacterium sp. CV08 TaxID=3133274 RepID=UPI003DA7BD46